MSSMANCAHVLSAPVFPTPSMMRRRLWTMDFLFVCSTPPRRLLWLHHAVRILVVRWSSELCTTFPMNDSYRVAICFLMLGISKNFLLTVSFVMCWSFTSVIIIPDMRRMLRCRNISRFFSRDVQSSQISHPHSKRLMGMVIKISYLLKLSTLTSIQTLARAPIDEFPADMRVSMS